MPSGNTMPSSGRPRALLPVLARRPRHELEFLPVALEIVETPAPPLPRAVALAICGFCTVAILWAVFGKIDIVANAEGTVIPAGKVKPVQALATANVEQILVDDGDHVTAGQPLIRLDAVSARAAGDRAAADLRTSRLAVAGLSALSEQLASGVATVRFVAPPGLAGADVGAQAASIQARFGEQRAKLASLDQQMAEKRVEAVEDARSVDKLKAELPMLAGVAAMYSSLYQKNLATKIDLLSSQQKLSDAAHDYAIQTAHRGEAETELTALQSQAEAQRADYAHAVLQDLADARQKLAQADAADRDARHQVEDAVLRAPVAGTVQQLSVHSHQAVVNPGEQLMVVVPDDSHLVVEAMIANRDIGFVSVGQKVQVKVAAFKFTQYGLLPGRVILISRDAVDDTTRNARSGEDGSGHRGGQDDAASSSDAADGGQGSGYVARIALDETAFRIDGQTHALEAGMAVTAEILTGRRRVIQFVLSPLEASARLAGRER